MRKNNLSKIILSTVVLTTLLPWPMAIAFENIEEEEFQLEEIVVSARRRQEKLQDVPIAATVFAEQNIKKRGFRSAGDIAAYTPNLQFSGAYESIPKITLRGVGTNGFVQNINPAVGVYIDDVYQGLAAGQNFQLFDLDRIEVLRGPQGTMFGKNTTGGAIIYSTHKPNHELEGGASVTYGRFNRLEIEGSLNIPIGDRAAVRLSGLRRSRGGYWNNLTIGDKDGKLDQWAGRVQLLLDPTENLEIIVKFEKADANDDLRRSRQTGRLPSGSDVTGYVAPTEFYSGESDLDTFENINTTLASLRANWTLPAFTITAVTGFNKVDRKALEDADEGPLDLLSIYWNSRSKSISQEFRLAGAGEEISWILGGYFGREKHNVSNNVNYFGCFREFSCAVSSDPNDLSRIGAFLGAPSDVNIQTFVYSTVLAANGELVFEQINKTWAGFGEVTLRLAEKWSVTAGLRYTQEDRSINAVSVFDNQGVVGESFTFNGKSKWSKLSGRVIIDYKPSEGKLLYASVSRGFRAGNYNGGATFLNAVQNPVNPETVTSYEVGGKFDLLDRRLSLNSAVFYMDFSDKQEAVLRNALLLQQNAADVTIKGAELELQWMPGRSWLFTAAGGFLDATYDRFTSDIGDYRGNRLTNAPKLTLSATAEYLFEFGAEGENEGFVGADIRRVSQNFYQADNDAIASEGGYVVVNARIGLSFGEGKYRASFAVRNLTNEKYIIDANNIGEGFYWTILTEGMPRTWEFRLAANF